MMYEVVYAQQKPTFQGPRLAEPPAVMLTIEVMASETGIVRRHASPELADPFAARRVLRSALLAIAEEARGWRIDLPDLLTAEERVELLKRLEKRR